MLAGDVVGMNLKGNGENVASIPLSYLPVTSTVAIVDAKIRVTTHANLAPSNRV